MVACRPLCDKGFLNFLVSTTRRVLIKKGGIAAMAEKEKDMTVGISYSQTVLCGCLVCVSNRVELFVFVTCACGVGNGG
jgi:hypothetical protein